MTFPFASCPVRTRPILSYPFRFMSCPLSSCPVVSHHFLTFPIAHLNLMFCSYFDSLETTLGTGK
jgi:hypothetical protein